MSTVSPDKSQSVIAEELKRLQESEIKNNLNDNGLFDYINNHSNLEYEELKRNFSEATRSPTHKPHPDSYGCELDEGEVVGVVLFIARGDGPEVFEFVEEALDEVAVSIEKGAERRHRLSVRHRLDVGPGTPCRERGAQRIAVIGRVGEQDLAVADIIEHVGRALAVMGLAFAELERDRQAVGVDQGMDLGRQPAARAPHASGVSRVPSGGVRAPFFTLAAC